MKNPLPLRKTQLKYSNNIRHRTVVHLSLFVYVNYGDIKIIILGKELICMNVSICLIRMWNVCRNNS